MSHTPTPWFINGPWHIQSQTDIEGYRANGEPIPALPKIIAKLTPIVEREANAAFIVRACNAHEELVKALRYALECLEEVKEDEPLYHFYHYGAVSVDEQARTVLRKVQGAQEEVRS